MVNMIIKNHVHHTVRWGGGERGEGGGGYFTKFSEAGFSTQNIFGPNQVGDFVKMMVQKDLKSMMKGVNWIENQGENTLWWKFRPTLGPSISGTKCHFKNWQFKKTGVISEEPPHPETIHNHTSLYKSDHSCICACVLCVLCAALLKIIALAQHLGGETLFLPQTVWQTEDLFILGYLFRCLMHQAPDSLQTVTYIPLYIRLRVSHTTLYIRLRDS